MRRKQKIFFSKNVSSHDGRTICRKLGYGSTDNLGRYLGVPLLHRRVTKDTYQYLEHQVGRKLAGWKAKSLSLAGRITLARSVLEAIPTYAMQSIRLLRSTYSNIESMI